MNTAFGLRTKPNSGELSPLPNSSGKGHINICTVKGISREKHHRCIGYFIRSKSNDLQYKHTYIDIIRYADYYIDIIRYIDTITLSLYESHYLYKTLHYLYTNDAIWQDKDNENRGTLPQVAIR